MDHQKYQSQQGNDTVPFIFTVQTGQMFIQAKTQVHDLGGRGGKRGLCRFNHSSVMIYRFYRFLLEICRLRVLSVCRFKLFNFLCRSPPPPLYALSC